jgi:hypothetical protein
MEELFTVHRVSLPETAAAWEMELTDDRSSPEQSEGFPLVRTTAPWDGGVSASPQPETDVRGWVGCPRTEEVAVTDVFRGIGDRQEEGRGAALSDAEVARLDRVVDGAAVFGAELETTYRVLALTVEPTPDRYPWGEVADRRLQLLASPVSTMLVALRRVAEDGTKELLTFERERLVDVVAALDGPRITSPVVGLPEPRPGEWAPRFSLEGRSTAPDGRSRTLRLELEAGDLQLGLFARFDDIELRGTDGSPLRVSS